MYKRTTVHQGCGVLGSSSNRTARLLTLFSQAYCMPRQSFSPLASQISPEPANYITVFLTALIGIHECLCWHTLELALMSWQSSLVGLCFTKKVLFFFCSLRLYNNGSRLQEYVKSASCPSHVRRSKPTLPRPPSFGPTSRHRILKRPYQRMTIPPSPVRQIHLSGDTKSTK